MERTERIYKINQLLEDRRIVPFGVLMEELGVSRATVKRDLEYLRDRLHAPIVWDRERGLLVWRGMATAALKRDYHKNEAKLAKALDKLMKQWGKMYGDRARAIRRLKVQRGG